MTTNNRLKAAFTVLLAVMAPLAALAEELGDPAPPLAVKEWIKGTPVEVGPGSNIFVVVIWATKGRETPATFTKLNEIQKKYKDRGVIIVGLCDESPERIKNFFEQPEMKVDFAIAADTARRTAMAYMMGFKLRAVPRAFVVGKDGKFLWHGSPLLGLDQVLGEITAGTYEITLAKKGDAFRVDLEAYRSLVRRGDPRARAAGEALIAAWTNDVRRLCDFAYVIVTDTRNPRRDMKLAGQAIDLAEKLAPTNTLRLLSTRAAFLSETGRPEEAIGLIKDAIAAAKDPKEKAALEPYLKSLQARLQARSAKNNAAGTNALSPALPTNSPSVTNQTHGTVTNPGSAKPPDPVPEKSGNGAR